MAFRISPWIKPHVSGMKDYDCFHHGPPENYDYLAFLAISLNPNSVERLWMLQMQATTYESKVLERVPVRVTASKKAVFTTSRMLTSLLRFRQKGNGKGMGNLEHVLP